MNVTFVYRYLTLGGVEVVLRSRAQGLAAHGIHPTLWFLSDGPGRSLFDAAQTRLRVGGLEQLRLHLEAGEADVISIIDTPEALTSIPSPPRTLSVVIEVHTSYPENRLYLRSPACDLADAVFVPSEHQRRVVSREMPRPPDVRVVPNPIGGAFEAPLADFDAGGHVPVVAWVGRLDWLKDWRGFLRIAIRVMHRMPEVEFWIAGGGSPDEEADFQRQCRRSGVMPRLRWLRGLPHSTMPRLYDGVRASGGVVISTSRGESFGMAVAEAMARGCAVVAPRLGPFPEFITDGNEGRLYRAGKVADAADAVVDLLSESGTRNRMGAKAREAILRSHATAPAIHSLASSLAHVAGESDAHGTASQPPGTGWPGTDLRGTEAPPAVPGSAKPVPLGRVLPSQASGSKGDRVALFSGHYASGFLLGPGSSAEYTERLRRELPALLLRREIRSLLDAPCGEFGWFRLIARDPNMTYIGADIVPDLVSANQLQFGDAHTRFEVIDITTDRLPMADLWLCRDCLFHFSYADIFSTLRNFVQGEIRYLLTTTHPMCTQNTDIPTGSFRLLNLELPPFGFPEPAERIDDWIEGHPVRQLALWDRASIAQVLGFGPVTP